MSSDIELGDDDSITLACAQLRTRNTFGETQPIQVHGDVRVQNRIFLDAPPPIPKPAPAPSSRDDISFDLRGSPLGSRFGAGVTVTAGGPVSIEPGWVKDKEVYGRLKNRPLPVDLWEELQMLREAVLDLNQRLRKHEGKF